jgi:hypothetical protein
MRYVRSAVVPWVMLLAPLAASASVGTVSALEGEAQRTNIQGKTSALAQGAAIEVGDVIRVTKGGLKLTLNDTSVVMLAQGSDLEISEADFAGQERRSFVAKLGLGALWAKVSKAAAGSNAKFEVQTERAVAGVRGTIFQVEVDDSGGIHDTRVGVVEGRVAVDRPAPSPMAVASATPPPSNPGAGLGLGAAGRTSGAGLPVAPGAAAAPLPSKPSAPPAAAGVVLGAGEGVRVDDGGFSRGRLRPLPAQFERFIGEHGEEHAHDVERRDPKREESRERKHQR